MNSSDEFPKTMNYDHKITLKMNEWMSDLEKFGDVIRPGDNYVDKRTQTFNNLHVFTYNKSQYLKRFNRKTKTNSDEIELFERFRSQGILEINTKMLNDILE